MDLRANLDSPIVLKPLERCLVPTGLYIALPHGTEAQIRPRSGLALKKGITVLNSPGTIDADYRGRFVSFWSICRPSRSRYGTESGLRRWSWPGMSRPDGSLWRV